MKNFFSQVKVFVIFLVLILSEVGAKSSYLDERIILLEEKIIYLSKMNL